MRKLIFGNFILLFLLFSCDKNRVYEKNSDIPKYQWDSKFIVAFELEINDTSFLYDVYANIRHADAYPFRNLWIIVHTTFPSGEKKEKRIELPLADESGKFFGEGMGDIWDYRILIQQNAIFPEAGKYKFELEQNMRQDPLPMIMSMGLRVEKKAK